MIYNKAFHYFCFLIQSTVQIHESPNNEEVISCNLLSAKPLLQVEVMLISCIYYTPLMQRFLTGTLADRKAGSD
jgi:hypothetical protein